MKRGLKIACCLLIACLLPTIIAIYGNNIIYMHIVNFPGNYGKTFKRKYKKKEKEEKKE